MNIAEHILSEARKQTVGVLCIPETMAAGKTNILLALDHGDFLDFESIEAYDIQLGLWDYLWAKHGLDRP